MYNIQLSKNLVLNPKDGEGVDPELLAKVLANPEMAALLSSIAKNMK